MSVPSTTRASAGARTTRIEPARWLLDVLSRDAKVLNDPVFLVHHPDVRTLVGGAPVTEAYAEQIGADGYAADAASAADRAKELVQELA